MTGNEEVRWVLDPGDRVAHVLDNSTTADSGVLVTMCGLELPSKHTATSPVLPSLAVCPLCRHDGGLGRAPVVFPTPTHY